jgi:adenine-specific DNA-methyltransferase
MPTLNWIGKDKVVNHHLDVPYRVLEHQYGFTANGNQKKPTESGNIIIEGDNLEALKTLLPTFEGNINCISIDPPYNTGTENWIYNDNVNHPKIKQWLNQIVGKEGDDLSRHDKWLCMMYPRLKLMHKLLKDDGLIFINIDDNELHNLVAIMNEIFGVKNKISILVWSLGTGTQAGHFVRAHEYILVYAKNKDLVPNFKGGDGYIEHSALKKISIKNPESTFQYKAGVRFDAEDGYEIKGSWGGSEKTTLVSGRMIAKNGKLKEDVELSAGYAMKSQMKSFFSGKETFDTKGQKVLDFYFNRNGVLRYKKEKSVVNPPTVIRDIASTKTGSDELKKIFEVSPFDFPKPSDLIKYLVELGSKPGGIVLDSFGGSGTTGHAVLKANLDSGIRNFILIQMNEINKKGEEVNVCKTITAERIKRVIQGYSDVEGIEGAFDYYVLGKPIFKKSGNLNEQVGEDNIRNYIYYTETKLPLTKERTKENWYLLNNFNQTGYYFYYEKDKLTTLDLESLSIVKDKAEQYLIYADNCLLDKDYMLKHNIIFKKIPRDIKRF